MMMMCETMEARDDDDTRDTSVLVNLTEEWRLNFRTLMFITICAGD